MTSTTHAERLRAMAFPRVFDAHKVIVGLVYLAAYAVLDWISFIEPYAQLGITPWNPGTGLSFVLLLLFGLRMIPFLLRRRRCWPNLFNQQFAMPWQVEILRLGLIGARLFDRAGVPARPKLRFDPALASMRDLVLLMLAAVVSAAFVAAGYVGLTIAAGLLPGGDFVAATLRYWVGDVIGIMVVAPFALFAMTRRRILPMTIETLLQFAPSCWRWRWSSASREEQQFQLFYVLFLPIVWIAVRTGSEGVSVGYCVTQLGLILGMHTVSRRHVRRHRVPGADAGAGHDRPDRRRTGNRAAPQTESQLRCSRICPRLARLGSMGELAAAVAHELNQP